MPIKSFEEVWYPRYENTTNIKGTAVERGARALLKKSAKDADAFKKFAAAGADSVPVGDLKEMYFSKIYANPGPGFKRLSFALQGPLKDRNDYVSVGRKLDNWLT